jgi:hypothetical protein
LRVTWKHTEQAEKKHYCPIFLNRFCPQRSELLCRPGPLLLFCPAPCAQVYQPSTRPLHEVKKRKPGHLTGRNLGRGINHQLSSWGWSPVPIPSLRSLPYLKIRSHSSPVSNSASRPLQCLQPVEKLRHFRLRARRLLDQGACSLLLPHKLSGLPYCIIPHSLYGARR